MLIVVVGAGSIGTRHIENLDALGHEVLAVDIDPARLASVKSRTAGVFTGLEDALQRRPRAACICTFSNRHIEPALACANAGCHLFIEKPLSCSMDSVDLLLDTVRRRGLVTMVGCNMRFHPALKFINDTLVARPVFGKRLWADLEFGFYLPFAKKDYESSYMANRRLGGNLIFDDIHEIDLAVWLMGQPREVCCSRGILSGLKIDTEDSVDMMVRFVNNAACRIHMDYLQHAYSRGCKVVCEGGTIFWDFASGRIGVSTVDQPQLSWQNMPVEMLYNQMYVDEIKHFIDAVELGSPSVNPVEDAVCALRLAAAAERSAVSNQWELV